MNFLKLILRLLQSIFNPVQISVFDPTNPWYPLIFSDDFRWGVDWTRWDWREPWSGDADTQKHNTIWKQECLDKRADGLHLIAKMGTTGMNYCGMICSHKFLKIRPNSYISVIAKIPPKGFLYFPAPLWAYGDADQEIDVAEVMGADSKSIVMTHHWKDANGSHNSEGTTYFPSVDLSLDFHTYSVLWEPDRLTWFVDGVTVYTTINNIPTEQMYLVSNIQAGPAIEGGTAFTHVYTADEVPMSMVIKEIKVWQR